MERLNWVFYALSAMVVISVKLIQWNELTMLVAGPSMDVKLSRRWLIQWNELIMLVAGPRVTTKRND